MKKHCNPLHAHIKKHHKKYLLGIFGSYAVVKTILLFAGFLGLSHLGSTFAAGTMVNGQLNSTNVVTAGCATNASSCNLSNKNITSIAANTFTSHTVLQSLDLSYNKISTITSDMFNGIVSNVLTLDLSNNNIISIEGDTLLRGSNGGFTVLSTVSLAGNCYTKGTIAIAYGGGKTPPTTNVDKTNCAALDGNFATNLTDAGYSWDGSNYVGSKDISFDNINASNTLGAAMTMKPGADQYPKILYTNGTKITNTSDGNPFRGILQGPTFYAEGGNAPGIKGNLALMKFGANQRINFDKDVGVRFFVAGGDGNSFTLYSSNSENPEGPWTLEKRAAFYSDVFGSYYYFLTRHATRWVIGGTLSGSFVINNDDASTTSSGVTLNISGAGITNMRFQNDTSGGSRSAWEAYSATKARTLSAATGTKTVYAQFDSDGDNNSDVTVGDDILYTGAGGGGGGSGGCATGSYCGDLRFEVISGVSYCEYGTTLDFGQTGHSYSARSLITGFVTHSGNTPWFCIDNQGLASWALTIQSSDVLNITTNNSVHTIPASSVFIKNPDAYVASGSCTHSSGDSLNNRVDISGAKAILGKVGNLGEGCNILTDNVDLKVDLTGSQAVGQYSGTLTISLPSF